MVSGADFFFLDVGTYCRFLINGLIMLLYKIKIKLLLLIISWPHHRPILCSYESYEVRAAYTYTVTRLLIKSVAGEVLGGAKSPPAQNHLYTPKLVKKKHTP